MLKSFCCDVLSEMYLYCLEFMEFFEEFRGGDDLFFSMKKLVIYIWYYKLF